MVVIHASLCRDRGVGIHRNSTVVTVTGVELRRQAVLVVHSINTVTVQGNSNKGRVPAVVKPVVTGQVLVVVIWIGVTSAVVEHLTCVVISVALVIDLSLAERHVHSGRAVSVITHLAFREPCLERAIDVDTSGPTHTNQSQQRCRTRSNLERRVRERLLFALGLV